MESKHEAVLRDPGTKKLLTHLVNVPSRSGESALNDWGSWMEGGFDPETLERAKQFIEKYGPIRDQGDPGADLLFVAVTGGLLRHAWTAGEDERLLEQVNVILSDIVGRTETVSSLKGDAFRKRVLKPLEHPILKPDFRSGEWTLKPRDLLDAIAIELMHSRRMLHICERSECGRYFVKEFSRDRYCSISCSEEMRRVGQRIWARDRRAPSSVKQKARKKRK